MIPGIDISIYQGLVPVETWRCFYADGQRVAVIGAAHPKPNPYAAGNFANAERAGFRHFATYAALYPNVAGRGTIQVAKAMCGGYWPRLSFVAVDCETDGITKGQIHEAVGEVQGEGRRAVIYTARWWWRDHFGNPTDFKDLPLWSAYYDGDPDIDFPSAPYGGWTGVMGEQYAGTVTLCGVGVDKNSFDQQFIEGPPVQEDTMQILGQFAKSIPWQESFLVYADAAGNVKKRLVPNAGSSEALVKGGFPTKTLPEAGLNEIPNA